MTCSLAIYRDGDINVKVSRMPHYVLRCAHRCDSWVPADKIFPSAVRFVPGRAFSQPRNFVIFPSLALQREPRSSEWLAATRECIAPGNHRRSVERVRFGTLAFNASIGYRHSYGDRYSPKEEKQPTTFARGSILYVGNVNDRSWVDTRLFEQIELSLRRLYRCKDF